MNQYEASEDRPATAGERELRQHPWQHSRQSERSSPPGPRSTREYAQTALSDASQLASFLFAHPASAQSGLPERLHQTKQPSSNACSMMRRLRLASSN